MMNAVDNELIIKASGGDLAAFEEIYRLTQSFVYTVALKVTGNRAHADDVTQEVFISLYRNLRSFKFNSSFKTWVYRITVNMALNFCRSNKRHGKADVDFADVEPVLGKSGDVQENIDKKDRALFLQSLLNKLNPEQRAYLALREIEGLSYQEMAETLKVKMNTVRSRLKRAREALMACVRKEGKPYELF